MELLQPLFGSQMKLVEMLCLLSDVKQVVRQAYYEEELAHIEEFCQNNKLFLVRSRFKVIPLDADKKFSNKGLRVSSDDDRKGHLFVYISKDELLANKDSLFELQQNHYLLGRVLGYPRCCCEFFKEHEPLRREKDNDFILPVLEASQGEKFSFVTNIFHRDQDICLLSHFPCSLSCEESIKIGKKHLEVLKKYDVGMAAEMVDVLQGRKTIDGRIVNF